MCDSCFSGGGSFERVGEDEGTLSARRADEITERALDVLNDDIRRIALGSARGVHEANAEDVRARRAQGYATEKHVRAPAASRSPHLPPLPTPAASFGTSESARASSAPRARAGVRRPML